MRRLTLLLLFVVTTINMMCAQVPQGFTYQAIVRNNDGTTIATVAGMPGVILLPDNWTAVPNIGINHEASNYVTNIYNVTQWNILQNNGAVFLPAAGEREDNTISNVGIKCCYWSSSYSTSSGAYRFHTDVPSSMPYKFNHINNYIGCSVRLIHDITELP